MAAAMAVSSFLQDDVVQETHTDLSRLRAAWLNERMAPELLPYDATLIDNIRELVAYQVRIQCVCMYTRERVCVCVCL
jgi:hypothetical protein